VNLSFILTEGREIDRILSITKESVFSGMIKFNFTYASREKIIIPIC